MVEAEGRRIKWPTTAEHELQNNCFQVRISLQISRLAFQNAAGFIPSRLNTVDLFHPDGRRGSPELIRVGERVCGGSLGPVRPELDMHRTPRPGLLLWIRGQECSKRPLDPQMPLSVPKALRAKRFKEGAKLKDPNIIKAVFSQYLVQKQEK